MNTYSVEKAAGIAGTSWSIFLSLLMWLPPGSAAVAAPSAGATALCFRHVGPEDKPMPGFCVTAPKTGNTSCEMCTELERTNVITSTPYAWRELTAILENCEQTPAARRSVFGEYILHPIPSGRDFHLSPEHMRQVIVILKGVPGLDRAQEAMLERLRLRLAPTFSER